MSEEGTSRRGANFLAFRHPSRLRRWMRWLNPLETLKTGPLGHGLALFDTNLPKEFADSP